MSGRCLILSAGLVSLVSCAPRQVKQAPIPTAASDQMSCALRYAERSGVTMTVNSSRSPVTAYIGSRTRRGVADALEIFQRDTVIVVRAISAPRPATPEAEGLAAEIRGRCGAQAG